MNTLLKKLFIATDTGKVSITKISVKIGAICVALLAIDLPSKFDMPLMIIGAIAFILAGDDALDAIDRLKGNKE